MSTARASSVFLSSNRNTVLNQSACVFALGYFLKLNKEIVVKREISNSNNNNRLLSASYKRSFKVAIVGRGLGLKLRILYLSCL